MTVELDHVFTFVPQESPEADVIQALQAAGLTVDEERSEFPDGVMGRYVYFENAYLEVLWLEPNPSTAPPTTRRAMWQTTNISPFGVGMRWRKGARKDLPFPSRPEVSEWMRPGTEMRVLTNEAEALAPSLFVVPDYMAMTNWPSTGNGTSNPNMAGRTLTGVRLTTSPAGYPRIDAGLTDAGVRFRRGDKPLIELFFGEGRHETHTDLRPVLPLVLWH